jgi:hypothetical protein
MMDDEGSAKYLHTDYQALGSDLAGITSKAHPARAASNVRLSTEFGVNVKMPMAFSE